MGCVLWFYKASEDNSVEQVAYARYNRFINEPGYAAFPSHPNCMIRFVELSLLLENGKVKMFHRVFFPKHKTTETGSLDQDHYNARILGIGEAFPEFHAAIPQRCDANIIDMSGVLAHRRYVDKFMWKPTASVMDEVHRLFVKRSGVDSPWRKWPGVEDLKLKP